MPQFLPFVRRWFETAFAEPTPPQRDGWDAIASGRDTLIIAPTGSGKTLAAFLWTLDHLHRLAQDGCLEDRVHVIYVSPLRALNNDIEKNLREPLAGIRAAAAADGLDLPEVRVAVRTGDTLASARQAMTRRPPHILITTPESLFILLTSERFRPALTQVRFVIVDEVHALMGGKRGAHLAVTLERLQALVAAHGGPRAQRIGCSATVRPVDQALRFLTGDTAVDPVVIDAGFARELDVQVVAPVDDFLTAASDTVWEAALQQIAELVVAHRTTLVFAPSRRSAERLARDLNDRIEGDVVAAHHGSLSRRARLDAENRLKQGELRALVATSSLELGIDVGAIDLVVQLQSPRNVAAALQRVGRSGHLLSRVSKGRIVVTKGDELLEAAAVVRSIRARELDRVAMPEAPLDVLAQQVVASVAVESLTVNELWARVRGAAMYQSLGREELVAVIRALAEPLTSEVKGVAPRILWDRVNDRLHARRGSRLLALTAGGTIPDAGLYDVYVADTDLKVGTLDEEFVTESLPGDVFLLGSTPWRIVKVRADRVLVQDARGMSPTVPFWRGEHPSRSFDLGAAVGRLRRDAAERLDQPEFAAWAAGECGLDAKATTALAAWLRKAGELLDGVPDDRGIVVESFSDDMGGRHAMIHSVFGMRVNGAWGMALQELVRRRYGLQTEAGHVDDGLLLSFAPGQVPPAPARLATLLAPEDVDVLLSEALIGSPLFATRFRHAAVRALLIPRAMRGQRTPAWLQRLKADALLEAVRGQPDFPVVAETVRECFNDALDVPRLKEVLARLRDGGMWVRHVDTPMPSPFVYPLLLAWDWAYLDAGHAEERRTDAVVMRKSWSRPAGLIAPEIMAAVEADLQRLTPERRARDANELAALLDDLGDLTIDEIAERVAAGPVPDHHAGTAGMAMMAGAPSRAFGGAGVDRPSAQDAGARVPAGSGGNETGLVRGTELLDALRAERRVAVLSFPSGRLAWSAATDEPLYRALSRAPRHAPTEPGPGRDVTAAGGRAVAGLREDPDDAALERVLLRLLRTRGPVPAAWVVARYGVAADHATRVLDRLEARGIIRKGEFRPEQPGPQYVHIAVLDEMQRRQAHSRRVARPLVNAVDLSASLMRRHHLHPDHRLTGPAGLLQALERLQGEDVPVRSWEQDLLAARVEDYRREWLDELGLAGDVVFTPFLRGRTGRVGVALRENLGWLREPIPPPADLDDRAKAVLRHLELRGASFVQDVARAAGTDPSQALSLLWDLFWHGLVTPDTFGAIIAGAAASGRQGRAPVVPVNRPSPGRRPRRGQRRPFLAPSRILGRWNAMPEADPLDPDQRDEARARLLLTRYGVVAREVAAGDWARLRHALLRMEYGGEVVRGYFVEGLSGEQYALEEALTALGTPSRRAEPHVVLSALDPANLWGHVLALTRPDGTRVSASRIPSTWLVLRAGRPVVLAQAHGADLTPLTGFETVDLPGVVRALQSLFDRAPSYRPIRRLEVTTWDGQPIRDTVAGDAFAEAGFTLDGPKLSWDGHRGPRAR